MNSLTLRPATAEDSEFIFATKKASFKPYIDQAYGWDEEAQRSLHNRRFDTEHFHVVQVNNENVGYIAVLELEEGIDLKQIFLHPDYHSKGIGADCVRSIQEAGKPIRLRVMKVNPRAMAFYKRLGFRESGETESHVLMEWIP